MNRLEALSEVCDRNYETKDLIGEEGEEEDVSFYKTINLISMSSWRQQPVKFQPIFTKEGVCCTFNSMNSDEIYTDQYVMQLNCENPIKLHDFSHFNQEFRRICWL